MSEPIPGGHSAVSPRNWMNYSRSAIKKDVRPSYFFFHPDNTHRCAINGVKLDTSSATACMT